MSGEDLAVLRVRNRPEELARLHDELRSFAQGHRLSEAEESTLQLVLEEIVTNIISYAWDDQEPHDIVIRLSAAAGAVRIQIEDDGVPFDPTQHQPLDVDATLDQREPGGVGIHLLRSLATELRYRRVDGRNVLSLLLQSTETGAG